MIREEIKRLQTLIEREQRAQDIHRSNLAFFERRIKRTRIDDGNFVPYCEERDRERRSLERCAKNLESLSELMASAKIILEKGHRL